MNLTQIQSFLEREWKTLLRFILVGGSSFAVKAVLYAILSRWLWTTGWKPLENVIALFFATLFNYSLHRLWTFGHQKSAKGSAVRYLIVTIAASTLDAGLFYIGHELLGIYDFLILMMNAGIIAFFTFTTHRIFTFHENPWKKK